MALLEANPENRVELARVKGITGKTWNHPVLAHEKLWIRNAEEIACFSMPVIPPSQPLPGSSSQADEAK